MRNLQVPRGVLNRDVRVWSLGFPLSPSHEVSIVASPSAFPKPQSD